MSWRTWLVVLVAAIIATVWWRQRDVPVVAVTPTASPAVVAPSAGTSLPAPAPAPTSPGAPDAAPVGPASGPARLPPVAPAIEPSVAAGSASLPVPVQGIAAGKLTDTFSDARSGGRVHDAIDILAPAGTPVLAVADGTVEKLFDSKLGGLTLYQFEPSGQYAYYYAHLQSYAPGLVEKQPITRGQVIGYVGSTGNANPAAPHLHFAIFELGPERQWWKGTAINPYPLLTASP